jgi:hypothetical protein
MILGPTIEHLRAYCPVFNGNVAGTANFRLGLEDYAASLPLPAAYVVPLDQEAEPNANMVGYFQIVRKMIGVIVELDATADRRGQDPAMQYDIVEAALFSALINWSPVECRVPNMQGYQMAGGRFLDLDRARLFYQWEFLLPFQVNDDDGWHEPGEPVDLVGIEVDIYKAPPFAPLPPDDLTPPAAIVVIPTAGQPVEPPPVPTPIDEEVAK